MSLALTKEETEFVLQGIAAWLPMPFIAVMVAALREEALRPLLGGAAAGVVGSALLLALLFGCARFFLRRVDRPRGYRAPIAVGASWVALSLAFEFFIVIVWLREPVAQFTRVFGYANLAEGNFMMIALVMLFLTPSLFSAGRPSSKFM